jgi:hypothetical protein
VHRLPGRCSPRAENSARLGGSPVWRVGCLLALVGLAAVAALLHGSGGPGRGRLQRILLALAVAAVAVLVVASLTGPTLVDLPA